VGIHRTAHRHGIDDDTIRRSDPPKVLAIGPARAGNLLEVSWLELAGNAELVIHAMRLRAAFYDLFPTRPPEDTP